MSPLARLNNDIDARVQTIRDAHPDWLCGKGCDGCCRQLAEVPQLTAAEWGLLREGLGALTRQQLQDIHLKITALITRPSRPVTCPLLDHTTGACLVYAQRPVACRTYGFFAQRDKGLYCRNIESRVAEGALDDVVWGNHDAIDRRLNGLGESRPLTEWFERWEQKTPSIIARRTI
jgi:Fe-S-cluster containining protein